VAIIKNESYMTTSTWKNHPNSNEWNTDTNWQPNEIPKTCAVFNTSSITDISFISGSDATVNSIEFLEGGSAFTFNFSASTSAALTITGSGVHNHSIKNQNFIVACETVGYQEPQLMFTNSASAGGKGIYYKAGPESKKAKGGGVIRFCDTSKAGSANFIAWTGKGAEAPHEKSTVGGEISFGDNSSADCAHFSIYGTLGSDGDTFGNVVFHDTSSASNATFNNKGGTVPGGDGGNTQFYKNSSAGNGLFYNLGGTAYGMVKNKNKEKGANGGDVAFDGTATAKNGNFHNYPATVDNAYGGVTSFNNNPPKIMEGGASAGKGNFYNYGAINSELCGGGHVEFSAKYGSPSGEQASIHNYGSEIISSSKPSAGHTIFSVKQPTNYYPTAGNASIYNYPGKVAGAVGGYTAFSVYQSDSLTKQNLTSESVTSGNVPTAGNATIINLGSHTKSAGAGYTSFSNTSDAGEAKIIANAGISDGQGGQINFYDASNGNKASITLFGNGTLNIGDHTSTLTIESLDVTNGIIRTQLGQNVTTLNLSKDLKINSSQTAFSFWKSEKSGFEFNKQYTILTANNINKFNKNQFSGNSISGINPTFAILDNCLKVSFID